MHEVIIKRSKCTECDKAFKDQVLPIIFHTNVIGSDIYLRNFMIDRYFSS